MVSRQRYLLLLIVVLLSAVIADVAVAEEIEPRRRGMRQLAAELAGRFGESGIELRAGPAVLEIEEVGSRENDEPARFATRIAPRSLVDAMNRERQSRGVAPLRLSRRLSLAAGDRLGEMLERRYFAHVSPEGREPFEVIEERGYDFSEAGENLAAGFSSANAVVAAWMKSPGHRDNLLSPAFEEVGVAICREAPGEGMRGHTFVALYGAE